MAATYHWTEDAIFAIPYDRLIIYLDEIGIYHGESVKRLLPPLPEEDELAKMMQENMEILKRDFMK